MRLAARMVLVLVGLVALAEPALASSDRGEPPTTVRESAVSSARPLRAGTTTKAAPAPGDTRVVGVKWAGDPHATFAVEAEAAGGAWHEVGTVQQPDGGADLTSPDARSALHRLRSDHATDPLQVDRPDRVRVRVLDGTVHDVRVVAVGSPSGLAKGSGGGGASGAALPVGSASLLAAGLLGADSRRRQRGLAVGVVLAVVGAVLAPSALGAAPGDVPVPPQPRIVSRAEWGADESLRLGNCPAGPEYAPPRLVVVHHTATSNAYGPGDTPAIMRGIYAYYVQGRGYCDIGYNFVVDRYGVVYEGRFGGITTGVVGAHATGFNTGTVGVAMLGDFSSVSPPAPLLGSLVDLLAWKLSIHRINPYVPVPVYGTTVPFIIGHRDAGALSGDATACPGDAGYAVLPWLRGTVAPRVSFGNPFGNLEAASRQLGSVAIAGWAIDPDTAAPIAVDIYVDGTMYGRIIANLTRPDVAAVYPAYGPAHGFAWDVPLGPGPHLLCVFGISVYNGGNRLIGCAYLGADPFGNFEGAARVPGGVSVSGWAIDPDTAGPIPVDIYVNGSMVGRTTAGSSRPDVGAVYPSYGAAHGFSVTVPGTSGFVCAYAINVGPGTINPLLGCRVFSADPFGNFEGVSRLGGFVSVAGWAIDPDTTGPIPVDVYVNGSIVGRVTAGLSRPDVASVYPAYGAAHGFAVTVPGGAGTVCVYGINVGPGSSNSLLGCRGA